MVTIEKDRSKDLEEQKKIEEMKKRQEEKEEQAKNMSIKEENDQLEQEQKAKEEAFKQGINQAYSNSNLPPPAETYVNFKVDQNKDRIRDISPNQAYSLGYYLAQKDIEQEQIKNLQRTEENSQQHNNEMDRGI